MFILHDEDHVEPGQDGGHEVDVVVGLGVVPAPEHRVGGRQHRAARVQRRGYTGLRISRSLEMCYSAFCNA